MIFQGGLIFNIVNLVFFQDYDPQCDMSKEEIEWRCAQAEKVRQRMPQVEHQLRIELEKMRHYFLGDPSALKCWDLHMDNVHRAFSEKLPDSLSSPRYTPVSCPRLFLFYLIPLV